MNKRKNIYLIAGGGSRKPDALVPVFRMILTEPGKAQPDIAYIGTANGDDRSFFGFMKSNMKYAGECSLNHIILTGKNVDLKAAKAGLKKADIIFVSGGDVYEGMQGLNRYDLTPFLKELYEKGTVFFGISAGSIMLGTGWVNWPDPEDDSSAELFECMGIAPVMCDTHSEKDGWDELQAAVGLLGKDGTGYGIPSGGTIIAAPDGTLSAFGRPAACYEKRGGRVKKAGDLEAI